MNYLSKIIFFFNVFNILALKIKIGQNIDKFIFDQWEKEKEKNHEYYVKVDPENYLLNQSQENLFLLLVLKKIDENKYVSEEYEINGNKISTKPSVAKGEKYNQKSFEIDFTDEKPKYNLIFEDIEMREIEESGVKNLNEQITDIDLSKNNVFLENEAKKHIKDEIQESERKKEISEILKNLNKGNFEEQEKRWALFKIKLKDDNVEKYFYCNDIESIRKIGGIFDNEIEEVKIIKSNCEDIYFLNCFTSQCEFLKKLDLTNLKTKNPIDINTMFYNCKNLEEVIFPKGLKVENIALLFSNSNNIEKINFEDLEIDNLYSMALLCKNSNMKKLKFPKCKINNKSILILNKKNIINDVDLNQGFLAYNNLEEIDLTNVEFEEGAGKDMFKKNTVKKIILPENMKNLTKEQLRDIFNESDIKIIKIGKYELTIEKYDKVELFIREPEAYLAGDREKLRNLYFYKPEINEDKDKDNKELENIPKVNSCLLCLKCCGKCWQDCFCSCHRKNKKKRANSV